MVCMRRIRRAAAIAADARAYSTSFSTVAEAVQRVSQDPRVRPAGPPAFVFDIDGVLIRGKTVLDAARRAFSALYRNGQQRFPVCVLTNGGGSTEKKKAAQLSAWLDVEIREEQVVLAHTPMARLASHYQGRPVVVAGRGDVLRVAQSYGFGEVLTPAQIGLAYPSATPLSRYSHEYVCASCGHVGETLAEANAHGWDQAAEYRSFLPLAEAKCPVRKGGAGSPERPIAALLVFTDPTDWARDLQLAVDLVSSGGVLGVGPRASTDQIAYPDVIFSNPDLLWANDYPAPRFGQGAFAIALQALYKEVTGGSLPSSAVFGKPHAVQYRLVEDRLVQQAVALGLVDECDLETSTSDAGPLGGHSGITSGSHSAALERALQAAGLVMEPKALPFSSIFMVGDNPAAGARVRAAQCMRLPALCMQLAPAAHSARCLAHSCAGVWML